MKIYDDLALEAWTQRERKREERAWMMVMDGWVCSCTCAENNNKTFKNLDKKSSDGAEKGGEDSAVHK